MSTRENLCSPRRKGRIEMAHHTTGKSADLQTLRLNPASFVDQDRFGGSEDPAGQRGNCFQVCMAALLNLPLRSVPHFYDTDQSAELQWTAIQRWLAARGWFSINYEWAPLQDWDRDGVLVIAIGAVAIFSGKSPRGDFSHAVVGQVTHSGWRLLHDPHPSKAGFDGDPTHLQIVAPLPWAAYA